MICNNWCSLNVRFELNLIKKTLQFNSLSKVNHTLYKRNRSRGLLSPRNVTSASTDPREWQNWRVRTDMDLGEQPAHYEHNIRY